MRQFEKSTPSRVESPVLHGPRRERRDRSSQVTYQPSILARSSGKMRASKMLDVMTQHSEAWLSFSFNKTNLQVYEYRLMNRGPPARIKKSAQVSQSR